VHDKNGQPVSGLTRDDFTLYDEGQEQRIDLFSVESDRVVGSPAALAPGEYSNRTEGRTGGAVTVVIFERQYVAGRPAPNQADPPRQRSGFTAVKIS